MKLLTRLLNPKLRAYHTGQESLPDRSTRWPAALLRLGINVTSGRSPKIKTPEARWRALEGASSQGDLGLSD